MSEALVDEDADDEDALVAEVVEEGAAGNVRRVAAPEFVRLPATSLDLPDPEGRFAFGEDDLVVGQGSEAVPILLPASEFDISASESGTSGPPTSAAERGGETALFDFAASDDLGLSEPSLARALVGRPVVRPDGAAAPEETLYAGLIVQRGGKVERVVPFHGTELIVGRGPTCDLVLSTAGISRRHARFVREGESLRVFDLGSANGLRVNGERVVEHVLQLGDAVEIDDYALTFVLDREPLDQAVRSASVATSAGSGGHLTVLHSAPFASMPERDLVTESDEEDHPADLEKELEIVSAGQAAARRGRRRAPARAGPSRSFSPTKGCRRSCAPRCESCGGQGAAPARRAADPAPLLGLCDGRRGRPPPATLSSGSVAGLLASARHHAEPPRRHVARRDALHVSGGDALFVAACLPALIPKVSSISRL